MVKNSEKYLDEIPSFKGDTNKLNYNIVIL